MIQSPLHDTFPDGLLRAFDWAALGVTVATVFKFMPQIAAAFTVVWTGLRIYDWVADKLARRRCERRNDEIE